jgi:uridine kinase
MINIYFEDQIYKFPSSIRIKNIIDKININEKKNIVACIINNQLFNLEDKLMEDSTIKFLSIRDELGNRIYRRSLLFILAKAVYELFPDSILSIEHSLSNGIYCEVHKNSPLNLEELSKIENKMKKIISINQDISIKKYKYSKTVEIFKKEGFLDKIDLLKYIDKEDYYILYKLNGFYDNSFYPIITNISSLTRFKLHYKIPGLVLLYPQKENPDIVPDFIEQPKLASIFYEYERWGDIIGLGNTSELNKCIKDNTYGELIRISEALHEKKIANIADEISNNINKKRLILIAGPSSSGKTTFAQRLLVQLRVNGLQPIAISTDNYFLDRKDTPLDENGNYNFESIEAIDLQLFNEHLIKLIQGEEIEMPIFNFQDGVRENHGKFLKIKGDQPIIIEGIHGLNNKLTKNIPQEQKFKIYISALTQLNLDRHNRIPTTDTRLIRRIVRDNQFRGHSASMTMEWWKGVRQGEEKYIFPYQENADMMFNSALIYELAVLKKYIEPLLNEIKKDNNYYYEAQRLLEVITCFKSMPDDEVPKTSILREFIGNSCFQ